MPEPESLDVGATSGPSIIQERPKEARPAVAAEGVKLSQPTPKMDLFDLDFSTPSTSSARQASHPTQAAARPHSRDAKADILSLFAKASPAPAPFAAGGVATGQPTQAPAFAGAATPQSVQPQNSTGADAFEAFGDFTANLPSPGPQAAVRPLFLRASPGMSYFVHCQQHTFNTFDNDANVWGNAGGQSSQSRPKDAFSDIWS